VDAERAASFPFIDETGKAGRYLALVKKVLDRRGIALDKHILFGEFPTHQFNACVLSTPSGLLCLLNTGLLKLIYHICVASFYSTYAVTDKEPSGSDNLHNISTEEAATVAVIRIIVAYVRGEPHRHVVPKGYKLDTDGLYWATALCYAIRVFVLAHEVGHVVLGHTDGDRSRSLSNVIHEASAVSRKHDDEFAADAFAQDALLEIDRQRYFPEPIAAGGLGFLMVHAMILEVISKLNAQPLDRTQSSESHPSTWIRLRKINETLVAYYRDGTSPAREDLANCVVLQRVLRRVERATITANGANIGLI
jgi:hypothetical protein